MSAAQTGRTHDLHPTASRKPKESLDPWAPSTHDPCVTFRKRLLDHAAAVLRYGKRRNTGIVGDGTSTTKKPAELASSGFCQSQKQRNYVLATHSLTNFRLARILSFW